MIITCISIGWLSMVQFKANTLPTAHQFYHKGTKVTAYVKAISKAKSAQEQNYAIAEQQGKRAVLPLTCFDDAKTI